MNRPIIVAVALLLTACASPISPTAAPAPSAAPTTTPLSTATPVPSLVLVAEAGSMLDAALLPVAEEFDLMIARATSDSALDDSAARIVVTSALPPEAADVPVIYVGPEPLDPSSRLSVVGTPRMSEAGFLAGVMTGLAGDVGWVGVVTGTGDPTEPETRAGFEQGLKYACPKCQLVSIDVTEASVDGFRGKGVEVVLPMPGPGATEIAAELAGAGLWLVWVGELPRAVSADRIAGRVAFDPGPPLLSAVRAALGGEPGAAWPLTIKSGGILFDSVDPEVISPGRQRILREAYQGVAEGSLSIGLDPD